MIHSQLYLFLIFITNGIIIGLLFDSFRILRKAIKTSDFITYIEDALFWILTGLIILYSIFVHNNGEIRLFMFIAILIGLVLYIIFVSKFILKISLSIINIIKKIFLSIFHIVEIPFKAIGKLLKKTFFKPISFIIINIRNYFTKISNKFVKNTKN